jgi:16S rRNA (adenine1518-N6/adenine1519-N6)-dimethyltransferase
VTLTRLEVRRLLDEHGLRPDRALGQHFVADPNTVRRIVRVAGVEPGTPVVEIGAGLGSLTVALAEAGARVVPVEVVEADAFHLDWMALLGPEEDWWLVANLPYNVATPLVLLVLDQVTRVRHLTVMVQREVGERMAAAPGDPAYGAVSVRIAYWARASLVGRVPATVFVPRPRVDSVLVRIERRQAPAVDPGTVGYDRLVRVVRAGFGQRRKMLRRSLAGVVDHAAFAGTGISPEARAEELTVQEWGRLAAWGTGEVR